MGKTRRARTKYHLSSVKSDSIIKVQNDSSEYESLKSDDVKITTNDTSDIPEKDRSMDTEEATNLKNDTSEKWEDIFKNIDINPNELATSLEPEENRKNSTLSFSKCIKRSIAESGINIQLKKSEKRKLRREFIIKAINAMHPYVKNNNKKRPKKSNVIGKSSEVHKPQNTKLIKATKLPKELKPTNKPSDLNCTKVSKRKQKSMEKVNRKTQDMLKNLEFYNQIISDTKYRSDAMGVVTDAIQKRVYSDL